MILVLENGSISETGSHQQLMDKGGIYARIQNLQNRHNYLLKNLEERTKNEPADH